MTNVPDCLEDDHTASDPVRADFHNVHLARNPARSAAAMGLIVSESLLENTYTSPIAKLCKCLWRAERECYWRLCEREG